MSRGLCPGGLCPGGLCPGRLMSWRLMFRGLMSGRLMSGFCPREVLDRGLIAGELMKDKFPCKGAWAGSRDPLLHFDGRTHVHTDRPTSVVHVQNSSRLPVVTGRWLAGKYVQAIYTVSQKK